MKNPLLMKGSRRVLRGGAWSPDPGEPLASQWERLDYSPTDEWGLSLFDNVGFRLFRSQDKK